MSGERDSAPFVVTLGETMVALVAEEAGPLRYASRFQRRAAGAESNVAIGLAHLGVSAGWVSRVGDDEFGRYVCATVRGEGVDVSRVELDPERPTGIMIKELRPVGKSRVLYYRSGSAASALSPQTLPTTYLQQARHLHLTGITPALSPSCAAAALTAAGPWPTTHSRAPPPKMHAASATRDREREGDCMGAPWNLYTANGDSIDVQPLARPFTVSLSP